ncbi:prepilin-type N-terminal cleavage/methylation domain-containing protein [Natroniella sulfidigena]|uniref:GspH/FimT family pseudopilin n=1 Tax=Natroniella sulfidigena TaxID=723921 RepID=UPI002009E580|nr:GspH/FimT family pseudopilin [Natroniella sulfidigena]MCK8817484.1 prepilin-type N-terminal cleavage/methylation domain-containing protein [Natroniella sulfidigena]
MKINQQQGFTLVELLVVCAIVSGLLLLVGPKFNNYLAYLELETTINQLVSDLKWARQQAVINQKVWGVVFDLTENKYLVVEGKLEPQVIRKVELEEKVAIKEVTLPEYNEFITENFNAERAVFFKKLGNLAGHNGAVKLELEDYGTRKIVYSSNAGELNLE